MQAWTWKQVWERRLIRHWLIEPASHNRMLDVVAEVCGIHAQVALRAEVMFECATRELPLWLAALRAKPPPRDPTPAELDALPPHRRDEALQAIHAALDGRHLTREELGAELAQRLGEWATEAAFPAFGGQWPRWQLALSQAAVEGLLVFGPSRGNRVTYVRSDQWIGAFEEVDGEAALSEVCRRYFAAYGPAHTSSLGAGFQCARSMRANLCGHWTCRKSTSRAGGLGYPVAR